MSRGKGTGNSMIKWNHKGFEEILCSDGARNVCEAAAKNISGRAEARGLECTVESGYIRKWRSKRVSVDIKAEGENAAKEAEDHTLISSLLGG